MSVLITGGAGYIGSHMVWECIDHDEEVIVLDNLVTGFDWAVCPKAKLVIGDIADRALVENTIRENNVDTIVHFAGSVVVPESFEMPLKYYENNTSRTRTLLEVAVRCNIKQFIFSSTAAVYAAPTALTPVNETAPLVPSSPYGASKLMSEMMIRDVAEAHDMRYVMLRYFNVAGADPLGRTGLSTRGATHVMKLACEAATGKRSHFDVYGTDYDTPDGSALRDFIHVSDLVNAHYAALKFLRGGGLKFTGNAGYCLGSSVLEVVDAVKRVSGVDFEVRNQPRRKGDIPAIVADASRMMRRLDWGPRYRDLDTIVEHALSWERKLGLATTDSPPIAPGMDNLTNRLTLV
ncbi:MAG: UDP-glucose 4-epimerase GalE [Rhizobiaceae bacterium]